jgi:hypothetical protein
MMKGGWEKDKKQWSGDGNSFPHLARSHTNILRGVMCYVLGRPHSILKIIL